MSTPTAARSGGRRAAIAITLGVVAIAALSAGLAHVDAPDGAGGPVAGDIGTTDERSPTAIVLDSESAAAFASASDSDSDSAAATAGVAAAAAHSRGAAAREALLAAVGGLQQAHRFGEAEALLSDWLVRSPTDPRVLLVRSQLRVHAGNARGALADCMTAAAGLDALAASGCEAQARGALADVRGARRLVETALARAAEGGTVDAATESWASGIAAELADRDGDDAAADRWHRRAVALDGDAHYPPLAYADFLLARGRRADALRVLASAPDTPEVTQRRGRAEGRS